MKTPILLIALFASSISFAASETTEVYEYCDDLPIKQTLKVIIPRSRSKITNQYYSLRRDSEKVYDVYLNPKFSASEKFDREDIEKDNVNASYREYVEKCFRQYESALKDERGRQLRLHVFEQDKMDLNSAPPVIKVQIMDKAQRSNSFHYNSRINCATVIHESLHLLGLLDEYTETSNAYPHSFKDLLKNGFAPNDKADIKSGKLPAYDCRAKGPKDSVMVNQNYLNLKKGLYSAHVNAIIYPNCEARNEKYYSCAKFSFRSSFEANGALPDIFDCKKQLPEYCKTSDWIKTDE